jgi:hypothetical protein
MPSLNGPAAYAALAAAGGFDVSDLAITAVAAAYNSSTGYWSVVAALNVTVSPAAWHGQMHGWHGRMHGRYWQ